jgi:hypothetical protein
MHFKDVARYAKAHVEAKKDPYKLMQVNADAVSEMLEDTKGVAFASITTATEVKLAAAHKDKLIIKVSRSNVILANNLHNWTSVYRNKVERETGEKFELSDNWFEHTDCFSVVRHKGDHSKLYLYAIFNTAHETAYWDWHTGIALQKTAVAAMLTPSAREKFMKPVPTYNARNDVEHSVVVRTIGLQNVVELKVNGEEL